jgi:folylpolyglutamate synthase
MAESMLRREGLTTGLFTSPHLVVVRERIKLNGHPISEELFSKYFWLTYDRIAPGFGDEVLHFPFRSSSPPRHVGSSPPRS